MKKEKSNMAINNDQLKKFKEALADIIVSSQGLCTYDACKDVAEREATFLISMLLPEPNIQSSNIKDQIRAEIERRKIAYRSSDNLQDAIRYDEITDLLAFLDTLPESAKRGYKDCNGCEYNRTIKDQIGWQFRGCFGGEYKGKPIAEIELCPLKVDTLPEQPVEGLDVTDFCKPIDPGIAQCVADHWWELLDDENAADKKAVKEIVKTVHKEVTRQVCVTCKDGELWEGKGKPSDELTTEVEKYFQGLWPGMKTADQCNTDMHFTPPAIMRLARHFAEWGAEHLKR